MTIALAITTGFALIAAWAVRSRMSPPTQPSGTTEVGHEGPPVKAALRPIFGRSSVATEPVPAPESAAEEETEPVPLPDVPLNTKFGRLYLEVVKRMNLDPERERLLRSKLYDEALSRRIAHAEDYRRGGPVSEFIDGRWRFFPERVPKDVGQHYQETKRVMAEDLEVFTKTLFSREELGVWVKTFHPISETLVDLSRRPKPDLTGGLQHGLAALECVIRDVTGDAKATLGAALSRNKGVVPPPLDQALDKLWGFASEMGRHVREGREPAQADVELAVHVAAAVSAYLAKRLPTVAIPEPPAPPTASGSDFDDFPF